MKNQYLILMLQFASILFAYVIFFQIGRKYQKNTDKELKAQNTTVQAGILGLLALLLGFTFNMALQNATGLWIYILGFSTFLLLFCFFGTRKTKIYNSNIPRLTLAITLTISLSGISTSLSAQTNINTQEIYLLDRNDFNPYVEFTSTDITDMFNPEESSKYPSVNLFDGYLKTCWVAGSAETHINPVLYIKLPDKIDVDEIILNIFSGYGKSKNLYYANARPHKINLTLFAAVYPEGFSTEVANLYVMEKYPLNKTINLADTFDVQSFPLNFDKKELLAFQKRVLTQAKNFSGREYKRFAGYGLPESYTSSYIMKIEIMDFYPGTKYDDICISEIFFNDRFVTHYPDKFYETLNVYIKDDNTLLADYKDKKGIVICKDTASVFTYIEWPENENWAILNYVPNDQVGEGSRIEEIYSLIDLKNREIVDLKFEKCTGTSVMFKILSKEDNGKVYIENKKFKIELK